MAAPRPFLKSSSPLQSPVLCFEKGSRRRDEGKPLRIAVLLGDLSNPFWEEMERAYRAAAKDRAMKVEFFRARPEEDREAQAGALLDIITMPFDAIVVNPIRSKNLAPGIIRAAAAGIPVLDVGAFMRSDARHGASLQPCSSFWRKGCATRTGLSSGKARTHRTRGRMSPLRASLSQIPDRPGT